MVGSFFAAALAVTAATAQQAKMFGTVTDETGAGVPNVRVILEPVDKGARVEVLTKGQKGSYLIENIRPGRYAVKVNAEGLALVNIKAEASGPNVEQKKESKWKVSVRARPDKATEIQVEDGMEITSELVVGKATEITTATGEKANASGDQVYALLRQQVRKGDCAGALPQIEKFTTDNPTHAEAFYLKGYCDAVLGRDDDAIDRAVGFQQDLALGQIEIERLALGTLALDCPVGRIERLDDG